jgi:hypothetical protein
VETLIAKGLDRGRAFFAFSVAVLALHHLPTIGLLKLGIVIDAFTPLVVVGTAALVLLAYRPAALALVVAFLAALAYVDGHGIHMAANAINGADPTGEAGDRTELWDETIGHIVWHLGWFGLLLAFCLAERAAAPQRFERTLGALGVVALGFTLFTSCVEGQTWPLMLAAGAAFVAWAAMARRPLLVECAGAFALAGALVAVWAIWQGGVPEFSEVWASS